MFGFCVRLSCLFLLAFSAAPAGAQSFDLPALFGAIGGIDVPSGHVDVSNGMSGTAQGWTAYGSVNVGLYGPLHTDGWRLKVSGHYSQYRYTARENYICEKNESAGVQSNQIIRDACEALRDQSSGGLPDHTEAHLNAFGLVVVDENLARISPHQAERVHIGVAPGYAATFGALTLKTYLGLAYQSESVWPDDVSRSATGDIWGAEGTVEAWLHLGESDWLSLDGSYFTGTQSYSAEFRYGHRPLEWLSLGPELAGYGDADGTSGRAGAFIRIYGDGVETTVSGGFSGTYMEEPSVYGAANFYMRF
jgi:hypothetical protein